MKLKTKICLSISLVIISYIAFIRGKEFQLPDQSEINKRVNYLYRITDTTTIARHEIEKVGEMNPEFKLFSYSFSTYAIANLIAKKALDKEVAIKVMRNCIINVMRPEVSYLFDVNIQHSEIDSSDQISALYAGHLNLMMGCYKLISGDDTYSKLNSDLTNNLIARYNKSESNNLESYPGNIWVPDNAVAMASIKLYSKNYNSTCDTVCNNWVKKMRRNCTNPKTKLLCSTIDVETGKPMEETRGSMLGWSIMFIYQFDPEYALDLYKNYREHFSSNFLIYQLFKERQNDSSTDPGDIDSGPIFLGYSIPANAFALSNAILSKDLVTARRIERMINTGAQQQIENNEFKYKVRFVDIEVSPMAEAIVLHSMSMERWVK